MYKAARIPRINPVRLIYANDELPQAYNTWPFDRGFHEDRVQYWEQNTGYQQKWNLNHRIQIYFDSLAANIIIHLIDENGNPIRDGGGAPIYITPGGTLIAGNNAPNGDPYYTYSHSFRLSDVYTPTVDQQILYFLFEHVYDTPGDANSVYYISEPQFFREKWDNCVWIEYTNDTTDYDVYFETLFPVFGSCVEGLVRMEDAAAHDTAFEDQQYISRKLESSPYESFKFTVGHIEGLPEYMRSKINRALSCDKVKIDGVRYTKGDGSKWTSKELDGTEKRAMEIILQEYTPDEGATLELGGTALILAMPMAAGDISFPCVISGLIMGDGFTSVIDSAKHTFITSGDLTAYIAYLNSTFVESHELTGTFSIETDAGVKYIAYNNSVGEGYHALTGAWSWDKHVSVGVATTGTNQHYEFDFAGTTAGGAFGKIIVDWGDGTVELFTSFGAGGPDYGATATASHTYSGVAGDTTYNIRVFHAGAGSLAGGIFVALAFLGFDYNSATARIFTTYFGTNIEAPTYLKVYSQTNQAIYSTGNIFDYRFLRACRTNLQKLLLDDSNITSFAVSTILDSPVDTYTQLKTISLHNNALVAADVDAFLCNTYLHLDSSPGFMDLRQSPAAAIPVTGTCTTRLNIMTISWGWTVMHD